MIGSLFRRVIRPSYVTVRQAASKALFDGRYGVDTDGVVTPDELGITDERSLEYKAAGLTSLRRILPPREVSDEDVFVDFGSGKGRVVLQAALRYPFRRVYGVELADELHEVACRNLETMRDRLRCTDVRLVQADVQKFDIPDDLTVAFFYNPFVGDVFETVVDRLVESVDRNPRRLRIVYGNPTQEETLLRTGRITVVRTLRGWRPGRKWSRSNSYRLYEVDGPPASSPDGRPSRAA